MLLSYKTTGDMVEPGEVIGAVANPYEDVETEISAPKRGMIIGRTRLPVVNLGDALFHIAWLKPTEGLHQHHGRSRRRSAVRRGRDRLSDGLWALGFGH